MGAFGAFLISQVSTPFPFHFTHTTTPSNTFFSFDILFAFLIVLSLLLLSLSLSSDREDHGGHTGHQTVASTLLLHPRNSPILWFLLFFLTSPFFFFLFLLLFYPQRKKAFGTRDDGFTEHTRSQVSPGGGPANLQYLACAFNISLISWNIIIMSEFVLCIFSFCLIRVFQLPPVQSSEIETPASPSSLRLTTTTLFLGHAPVSPQARSTVRQTVVSDRRHPGPRSKHTRRNTGRPGAARQTVDSHLACWTGVV